MTPYEELDRRARSARTLEELTEVLGLLLSGGYAVWTDGSLYSIKQLVDEVSGLKIEIFSRDHSPPHFHVSGGDIDAVFSIADCSLIKGAIDGRSSRLVQWWYERGRDTLIRTWNETRPSDRPAQRAQS